MQAMPEPDPPLLRATVSMPAYNVAPFIGAAIDSVLAQTGVAVELIVVDDASTDGTGDVARTYEGRGVRVLRNATRRGIGACHNQVLAIATAPVIAHVDADDTVAPEAIAKLSRAVLSDDRVGQAYCDFYPVDERGVVRSRTIDEWRTFFARHRAPPIDYPRQLVVHGMVVGGLRTYRRDVFDVVGRFDERLPWAVDYEMALRIGERFTFVHVPELLYARRIHAGGVTQSLRAKAWQYWRMRWRLVRRRLRAQGGSLFGRGTLVTHALLVLSLGYTVREAITPVSTDS
jgi:glycosyltransferase involved in cell wall biosynthesis